MSFTIDDGDALDAPLVLRIVPAVCGVFGVVCVCLCVCVCGVLGVVCVCVCLCLFLCVVC